MEKLMQSHSEFDRMNIINLKLDNRMLNKVPQTAPSKDTKEEHADIDDQVFEILQKLVPVHGDEADTEAATELWSLLVLGALRMNCKCHCDGDRASAGSEGLNGDAPAFLLQPPSNGADVTSQLEASLKSALKAIRNRQGEAPRCNLTAREREVLKWIGRGKSTWEISVILSRSESVIKWHVKNLLQKLSAVNRPQAVAIAVRHGLID